MYDRGEYGKGPEPRALFVDGSDLIWAEIAAGGPVVVRAPKDGAGPVAILGTWLDGDRTLQLFAVDAEAIYWLRGWQIYRVRRTGEAMIPLEMGTGHIGGGLLSDGAVIRVADKGCTAIGEIPKDGSPARFTSNSASAYDQGGGTGLGMDGHHIFCAYGAHVFALSRTTGSIETWVSDQEAASTLVVGDQAVFWANNRHILGTKQENLASTSKEAPHASKILDTLGGGVGLLLHDASRRVVYGSTVSDVGRIFSYVIEPGRLTVMLDGARIRGGFAQDETYIYWVSDTKIWRLAKDPPPPASR